MIYSKEQRDGIEKVKTAFQNYITASNTLDLLWSDKLGYILIIGISKSKDDIDMHPIVIRDAETLCWQLLYEIGCDVLEATGHTYDIYESTQAEKERVILAYNSYMDNLPEYQYLIEEMFTAPPEEN